MSSGKRHPYLGGYEFWKKNKFWNTIKALSPSGKHYYESWLIDLKQTDKISKPNNS
jgi:hypothetical protein